MNALTVGRGFLLRADLVNTQDTVSAPAIQTNIDQDRTTKRKLKKSTNKSKLIRVDQTICQKGTLRDHAKMYVPMLVKAELGSG